VALFDDGGDRAALLLGAGLGLREMAFGLRFVVRCRAFCVDCRARR
jgi:hypothetical protein